MLSILFVPVSLSEEVLFVKSFGFADIVDDVLPFEIGNFIQTEYAFSKCLESDCHISYATYWHQKDFQITLTVFSRLGSTRTRAPPAVTRHDFGLE